MQALIEKFYRAFDKLDAETMIDCYHEQIVFEDPAFGVLEGNRAKNMWRMLCKSQEEEDFTVISSDIECDKSKGIAHWEAHYIFTNSGRRVHNKIDAKFEFKDGKIIKHVDDFDLYEWSKQALGVNGYLIGWTGFFKRKLNAQTNRMLTKFENKKK